MQNTIFSILAMRVTAIVLHCEDTRAMQVGIDIANESDGYRITVGGYSGMQVGIDIGKESDGYRLTVEGYSGMQGRY